jgi:hypothetical protein
LVRRSASVTLVDGEKAHVAPYSGLMFPTWRGRRARGRTPGPILDELFNDADLARIS